MPSMICIRSGGQIIFGLTLSAESFRKYKLSMGLAISADKSVMARYAVARSSGEDHHAVNRKRFSTKGNE